MRRLRAHLRGSVALDCEYDEDLNEAIRGLPAARWDDRERMWLCSDAPGALEEVVRFADEHGFKMMPEVDDLLREREAAASEIATTVTLRAKKRARLLGHRLYADQPRGIGFLAMREAALLGWETGTGKTIVALSAIPEGAAVIVVCPAVMKYVWEEEAAKWRPDLRVTVLEGRQSFRTPEPGEIVVLNYDILPRAVQKGRRFHFPFPIPAGITSIWDEVKKIKSPKAQRTQAARALIRQIRKGGGRVWALEGTPLMNKPMELWSILYGLGLAEIAFGSYPDFQRAFDYDGERWGNPWGKPQPWVRERLARVMDRVRLDLPDPQIRYLPLDVKGLSKAEAVEGQRLYENWRDALGTDGEATAFGGLATFRKRLAALKAAAIREYLGLLEEEGEQIVLFSAHRDPVLMASERPGWCRIIGGESDSDRRDARVAFQEGRKRGIAVTIRAGGEGITLHRSRTVVFVDLEYNPVLNQQAIARVRRRGQKRQVNVVIAVARGTCDHDILSILEHKSRLARAALGDDEVAPMPPPPPKPERRTNG